MDPVSKKIHDREGNLHEYKIYPQKPTDVLPDVLQLLAMGAEPLARLIQIYLDAEEVDETQLDQFAAQLDWSKLGQDVRSALQTLDPAIARRLFRGVLRDGADLSVDKVYDAAYQANWSEYFKALWAIIQANGFFDFAASLLTTEEQ